MPELVKWKMQNGKCKIGAVRLSEKIGLHNTIRDFNTKRISEEFHEEHKVGKGKGKGKGG
jgi:hypothetical protein